MAERHSLQTYVSDMLAVERHIRIPFETQHKDGDFEKYADAGTLVSKLCDLSQQHIEALDDCLKGLGGHEASPVKSAVSQLEGIAAGAIDKMRKTKVSKALRDDYTALALCTASYTLLQSTALGLGDRSVADLAQRHLEDYARCVMDIGQALPEVALRELRDDGLNVDATAVDEARRAADQAWATAGRSSSVRSDTGTIGQGIPANEGGSMSAPSAATTGASDGLTP